jgi:2-keto-4-pentenoate hydratase/2-oxohepta-3-ene-1,7-dioic acid hydratase in catechol pathway
MVKLGTIRRSGAERLVLVVDDRGVDLGELAQRAGRPPAAADLDLASWLAAGPASHAATRELQAWLERRPELVLQGVPMTGAPVAAPLGRPPAIYCVAGNYARHVAEGVQGQPPTPKAETIPYFFAKPVTAVAGPYATVTPAPLFRQFDHEVELGVVIGQSCHAIGPDRALDYVAGYLVLNDLSARSIVSPPGRRSRPDDDCFDFLLGKWGDGCAPMGPYFVTCDEIADAQHLAMELRVNGDVRQAGSTAEMIFTVAELIAWLSQALTLEVGTVLATGTTGGVGYASGRWLRAGDVVEAAIAGLGRQRITIGGWEGDRQ